MKSMKAPRNLLARFLEYLLAILVFINGQSVYIRWIEDNKFVYLAYIAIFLTVMLIVCNKRACFSDFTGAALMFLYLAIYLFMTRNSSNSLHMLVRLCILAPLFYILCKQLRRTDGLRRIALKYSNVVVIFAGISVLLYLLGSILHIVPETIDTYEWAKVIRNTVNYYHLMYEAQNVTIFGTTFVRNCGIFCEAPSYAVPLITATFIELFVREKIQKRYLVVLILAIVTSWSTKALSIVLIVFALKMSVNLYFNNEKRKNGFKQLLTLIFPIVALFIFAVALELLSDKIESSSGIVRLDNIYTGWKAFRAHPLFGVGMENETALNNYANIVTFSGGLAMGVPVLLGEGGVFLTLFYVFAVIYAIKNSSNKSIAICFSITYFLILFTSNIPYFLLTIFIIAMAYSTPKERRNNNE